MPLTPDQARAYFRARRARKRAAGQCVDCESPVLPGRVRCAAHHASYLADQRDRQRYRIERGLCVDCPAASKTPARPGHTRCEKHAAYVRDMQRQKRAAGTCSDCREPVAPGYSRCDEHNERHLHHTRAARARAREQRLRLAAEQGAA